MPIFRDGTVNLAGIQNPGTYIAIVPPTPAILGVPTNIQGIVGVGSWGKVGAVEIFSGVADCPYGQPQVRNGDIASHVAAATQSGQAIAFRGVRVTDGSDTAATATVQTNAGSFTARNTGSLGNRITASFQASGAVGAYAAVVSFPGRVPERFDNIYQGLQSMTVVAGTGYTSVPALAVSPPQKAGGVAATATASLVAISATLGVGGTGHAVNDVITLGAGVTVKVTTVAAGVITAASLLNAGSITSGGVPVNVGAQTATTGSGVGATFTLVFGLGPASITYGSGYYAASGNPITVTMTGGGGTGGSYTPVASTWAALATAVNLGTAQRARSAVVVFTPGTSTASPTLGVSIPFSGGTDGATGVTSQQLVGSDTVPRSGMYALRASGADAFSLADCFDTSVWQAMLSFGIGEGMMPIAAMPSGTGITDAVAARQAAGLDDTSFWLLVGDWPTFFDPVNGSRLISPTAIAHGLLGNLSPQLSPINKPLIGVTATQTSQAGLLTADADEAVAQTGGVDLIGRSQALGATYFSFLTGRNASSNTAAQGVEYTRLTNFLAKSLQGAATRSVVGKLQSTNRPDDPTRLNVKNSLSSFFGLLKSPSIGADGYGMIDDAVVVCDTSNNPPETVQLGFLFAFCAVRYLNTVRYFIIKLNGGGNVQIASTSTQPTTQAALALFT